MKKAEKPKTHDFLVEIGKKIEMLRKDRGLTYEEVAMRVGMTAGHVYRMGKGHNITILTLLKVATVFDVAPSEILDVNYKLSEEGLLALIKEKKHTKKK